MTGPNEVGTRVSSSAAGRITPPPEVDRPLVAIGIERAIQATGLSRAEFSRRIHVSHTTVNLWVRGLATPTDRNLARMARLLGVEQEDLRNGLPDVYRAEACPEDRDSSSLFTDHNNDAA